MFCQLHRSMNNRRLHRANSFIRARKERAGNLLKKQPVIKFKQYNNKLDGVSSFLTIPNAFRQCTKWRYAVDNSFRNSRVFRFLNENSPTAPCILEIWCLNSGIVSNGLDRRCKPGNYVFTILAAVCTRMDSGYILQACSAVASKRFSSFTRRYNSI